MQSPSGPIYLAQETCMHENLNVEIERRKPRQQSIIPLQKPYDDQID